MYTSFYNLDRRPFAIHPDPSFLWLGEKQKEALTVLRYGIRENKGFLLLTGDGGIGKTTLINALTESVDRDVEWAVVSDPSLERLDFYNSIARGFKIDKDFTSKVQFLIQFSNFLHKAHDENKRVLLLVDDCHRLSQDMLEELRLLSNIEKEEAKLINIFFVGRREFNDMLIQPKNRAIRQRLTLKAELVALTLNETGDYIHHRLSIAGTAEKIFTAKAIQIIHRATKGNPRLINIMCDHAMVAGSVQGKRTLDHQVVEGCLQRLNLPAVPDPNDFDGLADEKSHLQHFRGRFTADSSAVAPIVSGFNLESDRRWGWVKYVLGVILVTVTGIYFYLPAESPRETARVESGPVVAQPAKKEAVLKQPIAEKTDSGVSDVAEKAREKAAVQTETIDLPQVENLAGQVVPGAAATPADSGSDLQPAAAKEAEATDTEPKPAPMPAPSPGRKEVVQIAAMEPNRVVLGLRPNSLELTGEAAGEFRSFVEKLKNYPRAKLLVKGFVSAKTNSPENVKLSEERAMGVQKLLVKSGIAPDRIEVKGLGNQEPVAANDTNEGRAKNRRVEVIVESDGR